MMCVERTFIRLVFLSLAAGAICSLSRAAPVGDPEVNQAMRKFRIQAFQFFRSDRHEYDRRVQYAQSVLQSWGALGAPASERDALIQFFSQATAAAQRGSPMPSFKFSQKATSYAVRRRSQPRTPRTTQRSGIVAPRVPALPRQPDRDWASLRPRSSNGAASPSTLRLQSRVPRATRRRMAAKPAPASPVSTEQRPTVVVAAAGSTDSPVDLTLLAARIRASNLKLSEVESELMARGRWDVQRLEPLVAQFDEILSGHRVSRLYYEALNDSERKQLFTAISPPQPVLSLLSQRWFEARVASSDAAATSEWPTGDVDDRRLDRIARTIDMWKSEYPGYRN